MTIWNYVLQYKLQEKVSYRDDQQEHEDSRFAKVTFLLEVKLCYDPVCPSVSVRWLVGLSAMMSLKGRKFHFHAPIGELV